MDVPDDRVRQFHRPHESGCFVMPNPWDVGRVRALAAMGFPAGDHERRAGLDVGAGRHPGAARGDPRAPDDDRGGRARADQRGLRGRVCRATSDVAAHVTQAVGTGIAGLSIEDASGDEQEPLLEKSLAVERIAAARQAIDDSGTGVLLTVRSEGFVVGRPDLVETIRRFQAYAEAGADCLYAPRLSTVEEVSAVVQAVAPKPVNLLVNAPFITAAQATALGVRRISVGGALARAAWGGWLGVARELTERGPLVGSATLPAVDGLSRSGWCDTSVDIPRCIEQRC